MSLFIYFKPALPSPAQSGIGDSLTTAANKEVEKITGPSASIKRKQYVRYLNEDPDKIGWYAAENDKIAAPLSVSNLSITIWWKAQYDLSRKTTCLLSQRNVQHKTTRKFGLSRR